MPHTQECRDQIASLDIDPGWCIGGCTMTPDDYPALAAYIAARAAFTPTFTLPDYRDREDTP